MFMVILVRTKQCFIIVIILLSQYYYDDSHALAFGKMKDEISGVAIEEIVGLKPKMYSILVSNSSEYKKQKV